MSYTLDPLVYSGLVPSGGSGSTGANRTLSNLLAPTAVNQDLLFNTGSAATIGTAPVTSGSAASKTIIVASGNNTGTGSSGNVVVSSGSSFANTGSVQVFTASTTNGNSGDFLVSIGDASATKGAIKFQDGSEGTANYVWTSTDSVGSGHWQVKDAPPVWNKETVVLSGTNITNQYVDLSHVAQTNSINFLVKGAGALLEGVGYDYSVSYTGGSGGNTRVTFLNDLATGGAAALVAGNVLQIQYQY